MSGVDEDQRSVICQDGLLIVSNLKASRYLTSRSFLILESDSPRDQANGYALLSISRRTLDIVPETEMTLGQTAHTMHEIHAKALYSLDLKIRQVDGSADWQTMRRSLLKVTTGQSSAWGMNTNTRDIPWIPHPMNLRSLCLLKQ